MKRIIGIIFVLFSLSSMAAKLRNYGIEKEKVVEDSIRYYKISI